MSICSKFFRIIFTVLIGLNSLIQSQIIFRSYNHSIFLVGWLDWLIWFDLVCELYLLFQSTQLEWTPRILGIKREVYSYLFIPPKGKVIIPVQTLDFSDIIISLAYSKFLGLFLPSLGHLGPFHFHLGHLWAIPFSFGPSLGHSIFIVNILQP